MVPYSTGSTTHRKYYTVKQLEQTALWGAALCGLEKNTRSCPRLPSQQGIDSSFGRNQYRQRWKKDLLRSFCLPELPSDTSQTSSTPAPGPHPSLLTKQRNAAGKAVGELKLGNVKVRVSRRFEALESNFLLQGYGVASREVSDLHKGEVTRLELGSCSVDATPSPQPGTASWSQDSEPGDIFTISYSLMPSMPSPAWNASVKGLGVG